MVHLVVVRAQRHEVCPVIVETVFVCVVYFYNVLKPTHSAFLLMLVKADVPVPRLDLFPVWVISPDLCNLL